MTGLYLVLVFHGNSEARGLKITQSMTLSLSWLLTLQETMVAPWRLMVQVVLFPLSMGTTGTWHAIFVIRAQSTAASNSAL